MVPTVRVMLPLTRRGQGKVKGQEHQDQEAGVGASGSRGRRRSVLIEVLSASVKYFCVFLIYLWRFSVGAETVPSGLAGRISEGLR